MCGIVGYVGQKPCRDILFRGLRKLEYRGYDSAGISILGGDGFQLLHTVGNLDNLESELDRLDCDGTLGIAHTRWATHGRPSTENAHPHTDCTERFVIVLNGIVENYLQLRARLLGIEPALTRGVARSYGCHWRYSSRKAIDELGYSITPLRQGLEATIYHLQQATS